MKQYVSPMLFNTITLKLDDSNLMELILTHTGQKKEYEPLQTSRCFSLIKHLHLQSSIYQDMFVRCLHPGSLECDKDTKGLRGLQRDLSPLLEQLEDYSLLSFRWASKIPLKRHCPSKKGPC